MAAAIPTILTDIAAFIAALAVTATGIGVLAKIPPVRWLFRNAIGEPMAKWIGGIVKHFTEPIWKLVHYHLGSNGTTPPIHERISRLEKVAGLEPVKQQPEHEDE